MAPSETPRKRSRGHDESEDDDLPTFEDPQDMVNAVITALTVPEEKTNVSKVYANENNLATEVKAYAKIAGQNWTFYVKSLAISIGRNTDSNPEINSNNNSNSANSNNAVDIDLGPAKVVSRQHATINYNLEFRCWELKVLGRNGARIDGVKIEAGKSAPLNSGAILDIGNTQMMFILPDSPPKILQKMLSDCLKKYKDIMKSRKLTSSSSVSSFTNGIGGAGQYQYNSGHSHSNSNSLLKSFQIFDQAQLGHSPSSATASSLQSNLDQDLSKEEAKDIKPPYSYATMITQAILSNSNGVMSLSEIYTWIADHYAYYKYLKTGWQNSIRHNLSLNKAFEKVPRRPNEPGKGMKWQISESYKEDFLNKINDGSLLKSRRGSSVTRQLQLHLATHRNLPEPEKYYKATIDTNLNRKSTPPSGQSSGGTVHATLNRNEAANGGFNPLYNPQQQQMPPKLGQPIQYAPTNLSTPIHYGAQQHQQQQMSQGINFTNYNQSRNSFGYQAPPMMYSGGQMLQPNYPQHLNQQPPPQQSEYHSSLSKSPSLNSHNLTPRLPKVANANLYNLQPPPASANSSLIPSLHSRHNSNSASGLPDLNYSSGNNVSTSDTSHSHLTTSNTVATDPTLVFTSPKKIAPLEAFTPERGSKSTGGSNKLGLHNSISNNQSSPAFWNFVQFSTPNGQTPLRKNSEELNSGSPTLNRKVGMNLNGSVNVKTETMKKILSPLKDLNDDKLQKVGQD